MDFFVVERARLDHRRVWRHCSRTQVENVKTGTVLGARDVLTAAGFGGARVRELNVNAKQPASITRR
jgi:hypothetical protein